MGELPLSSALLWLSVAGFAIAALASLVGLYYSHFHDNWPQHLGMIGLGVFGGLKIDQILDRGRVSFETAGLGVSVGLFAFGVALKVWHHNRKYLPPKPKKKARTRFRSAGY